MSEETKAALLRIVGLCGTSGWNMAPIGEGWSPVVSMTALLDLILAEGVPEDEVEQAFDAAAIKAGR